MVNGSRAGIAAAGLIVAVYLSTGGVAAAHDAHVETEPASGTQLDEPITTIHFEFDEPIGDDTEIAVFDPDEQQLESETTRVSETAAVVTFDEIDVDGDYIARYLTSSIEDGHLLAGAISFTYGSPSSGPSGLQWALMAAGATVILSIGAVFSFRRYRALSVSDTDDATDAGGTAGSEVDDDLSDVGV